MILAKTVKKSRKVFEKKIVEKKHISTFENDTQFIMQTLFHFLNSFVLS